MGMYDYLTCKTELPGLGVHEEADCQTKDLFCVFAKFTITAEGRLIEHRFRSENVDETDTIFGKLVIPRRRDIPLGDRDLEFHGDLRFIASIPGIPSVDYVARFTNGQLEWIKPVDELSEMAQEILSSRFM